MKWPKGKTHERRICHGCGREVARRRFANGYQGKALSRHKCPHGKWCSVGDKLAGMYSNRNTMCAQCTPGLR